MSAITRRTFLEASGAGLGAALAPLAGAAPAADRPPNLIVIMADDLGAPELGCYGHDSHHTGTLDHLAETGVKFETCYACPICHPSRFLIMTGQYGHHNGVYNFPGRRGGPQSGSPEDTIALKRTFAHVLRDHGYATAMVGKWQLSGTVPDLVHEAGFDEYCMWAYRHNLPEGVTHSGGWEGKPGGKTSRYWHPSILRNGTYVPTGPDDYGPDMFADFASDFMHRHRDQPFLLYYPMALTHAPYYSTPATTKEAADRFKHSKDNWQANVEYCDHIIGRLVATLADLGLRDRTVIFFTGDNGTGGYGKGQPTERGARVPMIVNGPGIVKARGSCAELVDLSDVLPTLCELAGAPVPADRPIDGLSLAPLLRGTSDSGRPWIYSYIGDRRILRDKRWLWEDNSPLHPGRFYDCGTCRDGSAYRDVTASDAPDVQAARARFEALLARLPVPVLDNDGPAAARDDQGAGNRRTPPPSGPWQPALIGDHAAWSQGFNDPVVSAAGNGLRITVRQGQKRGVAMIPKRYALPAGATHVRIEVSDLTPGASWLFKLAGIRLNTRGHYAAHTSDGMTQTGMLELPLQKDVLDAPDTPWIIKLGITGPPGSTAVFRTVEFLHR